MKISNIISSLKIIAVLFTFCFISCSKDHNDPNPFAITVTTANFSKAMDENPENGQIIGTVSGSTNEGSVSFLLMEQTPANAFIIDENSGELKVLNKVLFDFEKNPTISGTVRVYNGVISKVALVIITLNDVYEENIYDGSVVLSTQTEVNDFGTHNYVGITGDLIIGKLPNSGFSNIIDLSPLITLESIGGRLYFQKNQDLTSTSGLNNLSSLGSDLAFIDNPSLLKIEGLNNIAPAIAGNLILNYNPVLENLDGIINPTAVNGDLFITYNPKIPNLNWLNSLVSVEETLSISSLLELKDFNALASLQSVRILDVSSNVSVTTLSGFENLIIVSDIIITSNTVLIDFCSLQNLFVSGYSGSYFAINNAYNPTKQDIIDGNCSL